MAVVYGLISNRDNEILYVGQTCRDENSRFYEHYWNTKRARSLVYDRIKRERWNGFDIYCEVLEYCSEGQRYEREAYWIGALPRVINQRSCRRRGWAWLSPEENARLRAIKRSRRAGIPNWFGHVGVTYYPRFEAWRVQIQYSDAFYHLFGDGGPFNMGWMTYRTAFGHTRYSGDWYFSDGIEAVAARDRERERLNAERPDYFPRYEWPEDLDISEAADVTGDQDCYQDICPVLSSEAERFLNSAAFVSADNL